MGRPGSSRCWEVVGVGDGPHGHVESQMCLLFPLSVTWASCSLVWCSDPLGAKVGEEADRASHQPDSQVSLRALSAPVPPYTRMHARTHTYPSLVHPPRAGLCSLGGCLCVGGLSPRKVSWDREANTCIVTLLQMRSCALAPAGPPGTQAGLAFPHSVFETAQTKQKEERLPGDLGCPDERLRRFAVSSGRF